MGYTFVGYEVCWMFFMCTVFQQDAAEQVLNYMLYHLNLKKPKWLPARVFVERLSQMNNYDYVEFLPAAAGLYYSSKATNCGIGSISTVASTAPPDTIYSYITPLAILTLTNSMCEKVGLRVGLTFGSC